MGFKFRRGLASAWTSADPTLEMSEKGYETDTQKWKTGDGSTTWNSLPYDPTGSGDVVGPSSSVDSEVALFSSTTGKVIKRATGTGWAKLTSGVLSVVSAIAQSDVTGLSTALAALTPTSRQVNSGTGLTGGGDLSADRTLAVSYGTTSGTAAQGNDSRLSDPRTPTAHASTHATAASDPVSPASIGAAATANNGSDFADATTMRWNLRIPAQSRVLVAASSNITLSGLQTIDGVSLVANNRVLLPFQTTGSEGGIWQVQSGAWTRPNDFPSGGVTQAVSVLVAGGSKPGSVWAMTHTGNLTIDSGSQSWVVVNSSVFQPLDSDLTTIAGLTATTDNFLVAVASAWASRTPAQVRTTLGLVIGLNVQAWDADLDTWATKTAPSGTVVGTTDTQTLTNKTLTSPAITTPTGIVKGDVGLGNVDNTSDATKNSATATISNKRKTPRVFSTTSTATLTPEIDTYDGFTLTAQAAALTIANHSTSTPADFEQMRIRILDNGTARTISFGTNYVARGGQALPTTTVISKLLELGFEWNASISKWNLLSVAQES